MAAETLTARQTDRTRESLAINLGVVRRELLNAATRIDRLGMVEAHRDCMGLLDSVDALSEKALG